MWLLKSQWATVQFQRGLQPLLTTPEIMTDTCMRTHTHTSKEKKKQVINPDNLATNALTRNVFCQVSVQSPVSRSPLTKLGNPCTMSSLRAVLCLVTIEH